MFNIGKKKTPTKWGEENVSFALIDDGKLSSPQ